MPQDRCMKGVNILAIPLFFGDELLEKLFGQRVSGNDIVNQIFKRGEFPVMNKMPCESFVNNGRIVTPAVANCKRQNTKQSPFFT